MILTKISMPCSLDDLSVVSENRKSGDSNSIDIDNFFLDLYNKQKKFLSMFSTLETTQTDSLDSIKKMTLASFVNPESFVNEISSETKNDAQILSIQPQETSQVHPESFISQFQSNKLSEPLEQNYKDNPAEVSKHGKSADSNFDDLDNSSVNFDEKKKNFLSMLSLLETTQTDSLDSTEKMTMASSESFISQIQSNKLSEPLERTSKEGSYNDISTIDSEDMIIKGQETERIEPGRNEPQKITEQFIKAVKPSVMTDFNCSTEDTTKAQIIKEIADNTIGKFKQESANESLPVDFDLVASDVAGKTHNVMYPKRQAEHTGQKPGAMNLLQEDGLISSYYYGGTTITIDAAGVMTDEGDFLKHKVIEPDSSNSALNISTETKPGKTFQLNSVSNEIRISDKSFRAEVLNQVVEKISPGLKARQSEIRIDLKPESLGQLRLHVTMDQNLVNVKILAENGLVKEMIENQVTLLKTELLQLGIKIDKINVDLLMTGGSNLADTQHDGSGFKRGSKEFEAGDWQKEFRTDLEILESDHTRAYDRNNSAVNCFA